ncbi:MAG: hypothetical protein FJ006_11875 [Chloroflexi bacterium]|nr:hypothetical protein [Chloroflexota bacterium]
MSDKSVRVSSGNIGFGGLLTILFIGLKLGNVIDWSWWWVLSPLWISFLFLLLMLMLIVIPSLIIALARKD